MLGVILTKNEEMVITGIISRCKEFGNVIVVDYGSADNTVKFAKEFGVEVLRAKDKMDAIIIGIKKANEMKRKPIFVLREAEKDEKIMLKSLRVDFIKFDDLLAKEKSNYTRILKGYEPLEPTTIGEKLFYLLWTITRGVRVLVRNTWKGIIRR